MPALAIRARRHCRLGWVERVLGQEGLDGLDVLFCRRAGRRADSLSFTGAGRLGPARACQDDHYRAE
jgi:hypothetical protein